MRHARTRRWGSRLVLAACAAGSTGCIHNHYYGQAVPVACDPAPVTAGTTQLGAVCEVPSGSAVVAQSPGRVTTIGAPSRVVINSEPMGVRPYQRAGSRFAR